LTVTIVAIALNPAVSCKQLTVDPLAILTPDIAFLVFSLLPIKDLRVAATVSRSWRSFIDDNIHNLWRKAYFARTDTPTEVRRLRRLEKEVDWRYICT